MECVRFLLQKSLTIGECREGAFIYDAEKRKNEGPEKCQKNPFVEETRVESIWRHTSHAGKLERKRGSCCS